MVGFLSFVRRMKARGGMSRLLCTTMLAGALAAQAHAQTLKPAARHASRAAAAKGRVIDIDGVKVNIPDATVFDHTGRRARLYSDLIKGRIVVLNFFFTDCTNICHAQSSDLAKMQAGLAGRVGRDVSLVSISMNPARDTPRRLKQWARAYGVRPGWTLVSGDAPAVRKMIRDFTGNEPGAREVHFAAVFIGDDRTGAWVSADGLAGPDALLEVIDGVRTGTIVGGSR